MNDYSWAEDGAKIATCSADHANAVDFKKKAEDAYLRRDLNLKQLKKIVRNSASILKGVNGKNPKATGDWGIEIDDTPKAKKPKKS